MIRILWWTAAILAATLIFVGTGPATTLRDTIAFITGGTSGLMVGGIPRFVGDFKQGVSAGGGPMMGDDGLGGNGIANNGGGVGSWSGSTPRWGNPQQPQQRQQPRQPRQREQVRQEPNA